MLDSNAVEAVLPCRQCGRRFIYSKCFYEERGLTTPHLCRRCREDRKRRLVELAGTVRHVSLGRLHVQGDDGRMYTCRLEPGLSRGCRVVFSVDPAEVPRPTRARNVKAAE